MAKLIPVDELLNQAKEEVLDSREPVDEEDWTLIFYYLASVVALVTQPESLLVINELYNNPLSEEEVVEIHLTMKTAFLLKVGEN